MKRNVTTIGFCLGLGAVATVALLWLLGGGFPVVKAQGPDSIDTYYVAPGGSCGTGVSPCYASVQAAVDATDDPGDVVKVAAGTYTDVHSRSAPSSYSHPPASGLITQVVYISKTVTIQGGYATSNWTAPDPEANVTTLDALGQGRVFFVARDISPTIEGLGITGGDASGLGGGQFLSESYGGGLYVAAATVTIVESRVYSNSGSLGAGLHLGDSDVTLTGNSITANEGRGLYVAGCPITLANNTIADNQGGGLALHYGSTAMLRDNLILGNVAYQGGGMFLESGNATLINNVIADNGAYQGGGLYVSLGGHADLLHNTIARNTGSYADSGIRVTCAMYCGTVALTNTIVTGHSVGILVDSGSTAELESTLWYDNGSDWDGMGTISHNNNYTGDPAFVDPDGGDYHIDALSAARDAGIEAGITVDIDGESRPQGDGYEIGADEIAGAGLAVVKHPSEAFLNPGQQLTYTIVVTSAGTENATGVVLTDTLDDWQRPIAAVASVGNCVVSDGGWGGIVGCDLGTLATGEAIVVTLTAQVSTAVPLGQVMVNTVVVTANETANSSQATTYAQDCHVRINDDATAYTTVQAAVDAASPGDVVKIAGRCMGVNTRGESRQQVYLDKSLTLRGGYTPTNWTASNPVANPTVLDALGEGRVIYIIAGVEPTIDGLRITGGNTAEHGGGIYSGGTLTLTNGTVISNMAQGNGGGICNGGTLILTNSTVSNNTASDSGGGICDDGGSSIAIIDTQIYANTAADGEGGGIYVGDGSHLSISRSWVVGNAAPDNDAGGIAARGEVGESGSTATIENSIIAGNTSDGSGGGLTLGYGGPYRIVNSHIVGNETSGEGAAIAATYSVLVEVTNTLIISNTGNTGITDRDDSGSVFLLNYCDTYGNSPDGTSGVTISRTHCLGTPPEDGLDPLMSGGALPGGVGPAFAAQWMSYDYGLESGSPAIDAGTPVGAPATDIEGTPRIDGSPDLGAYEFGYLIYLPLVLRQYP